MKRQMIKDKGKESRKELKELKELKNDI